MTYLFTRTRAHRHLSSGRSLIGAALLAILVPSCALDPDEDRGRELAPEIAPDNGHGTSSTTTAIRVTDDTTITFRTGEDGVIAVSETAPGSAPSPLNYLVGAKRATPLEIFYSVADRTAEAPAALLADHAQRVAALDGTSEHRSAEPRLLSLPKPGAPEVSSFGACDAGTCDEGTNWYYSADCSLAADGQVYFDDKWADYGFGYHWYKSVTASAMGAAYGYPERSSTLFYDRFFTHLCNLTVSPSINHYVYWDPNGRWMSSTVQQGFRHVLHLFNASSGAHASAGVGYSNPTGNFKIGVMAGN